MQNVCSKVVFFSCIKSSCFCIVGIVHYLHVVCGCYCEIVCSHSVVHRSNRHVYSLL